MGNCKCEEEEEDEPEKKEELLVEDVGAHDAEGVVVLECAGRTVRRQRALRHLRKDHVEGIGATLGERGAHIARKKCMSY